MPAVAEHNGTDRVQVPVATVEFSAEETMAIKREARAAFSKHRRESEHLGLCQNVDWATGGSWYPRSEDVEDGMRCPATAEVLIAYQDDEAAHHTILTCAEHYDLWMSLFVTDYLYLIYEIKPLEEGKE